nr:hypothetical protein [uncultured Methanolobus sp.]
MSEKTTIPLLNKIDNETEPGKTISCTSCSAGCGGGCGGGLGIKAGSEKDIVFRNIFLYVAMGTIIFIVAYMGTKLLSWINP